ncbi:MAG: threonine/serine exporter family protein [Anaerolineales bacterium]|nr:threonine/serine exporter family protein [Anaerolineales bacterium]
MDQSFNDLETKADTHPNEHRAAVVGPKPPLDAESIRDLLATSLDAGRIMMEAGATTDRVEEVVHRIGTALGADWMDIFTTPTAIIAMATSGGEHRTRVQRIVRLGVDLARIDAINALSRKSVAERLEVPRAQAELNRIGATPRLYGRWVTALAVGIACAAFAFNMSGDWRVAFVTLAIAAAGQTLRVELLHRRLSALVVTAVVAIVAAALGLVAGFILPVNANTVISASILLLVPGVFLVGAVYDLIAGNLIAGLARGAYSAAIIVAIGSGIWLVLSIPTNWR